MRAHLHIFLSLCLGLFACTGFAEEAPLFQSDDILDVVLTAPLTQAYNERKKDKRLWMAGQFTYKDANGTTQRTPVSVRTRGVFRRANCKLPPLRLNFKKKQVKGTLLDGQDQLKLVAPCTHDKRSQQNIILEYLAYRALETLTEKSLKSRLLRVSYVDSDEKRKPWTHIGFLIEDDGAMAKRNGLEPIKTTALNSSQLDARQTALVEVFQLMIGNTDYSTIRSPSGRNCCHNVEIVGTKGATKDIIPVPYDFDSSGLVNAKYAKPPEHLPIKNVRRRYFTGRCRAPEVWQDTFDIFAQNRDAILNIFASSTLLEDYPKESNVKYMRNFFDMLADKEKREKEIIGRCRGKK